MCSILDIDLDYFNQINNPHRRLEKLLTWAGCPVMVVVENHNEVLRKWKGNIKKMNLTEPQHILHVDEHHDMMDEKATLNIANVIYHAMKIWPSVQVHWLVEHAIDSPAMWLSDPTWEKLSKRFTWGTNRPYNWPKPHIVSVCTSPEFISSELRKELMMVIDQSRNGVTKQIDSDS